jgi:hypothetical protein
MSKDRLNLTPEISEVLFEKISRYIDNAEDLRINLSHDGGVEALSMHIGIAQIEVLNESLKISNKTNNNTNDPEKNNISNTYRFVYNNIELVKELIHEVIKIKEAAVWSSSDTERPLSPEAPMDYDGLEGWDDTGVMNGPTPVISDEFKKILHDSISKENINREISRITQAEKRNEISQSQPNLTSPKMYHEAPVTNNSTPLSRPFSNLLKKGRSRSYDQSKDKKPEKIITDNTKFTGKENRPHSDSAIESTTASSSTSQKTSDEISSDSKGAKKSPRISLSSSLRSKSKSSSKHSSDDEKTKRGRSNSESGSPNKTSKSGTLNVVVSPRSDSPKPPKSPKKSSTEKKQEYYSGSVTIDNSDKAEEKEKKVRENDRMPADITIREHILKERSENSLSLSDSRSEKSEKEQRKASVGSRSEVGHSGRIFKENKTLDDYKKNHKDKKDSSEKSK